MVGHELPSMHLREGKNVYGTQISLLLHLKCLIRSLALGLDFVFFCNEHVAYTTLRH
jgi:hypothetical protein